MAPPLHRRLGVLRGPLQTTEAAALDALRGARHGLWVGDAPPGWPFEATDTRGLRRHLGRAFDALVLDEPDARTLGQAHGCVLGGGRLLLRLPPDTQPSRWRQRLDRAIDRADTDGFEGPLTPNTAPLEGTAEQAAVVASLRALFAGPPGAIATLTADRGRGKSAALGLALRSNPSDAALTGPGPDAVGEARRFCPALPFTPLRALLAGDTRPALIAVDEAAQIPVPTLRALVARHPDARFAFATTTRGYEGTGRGFVLRFRAWLEAHQRARGLPCVPLRLRRPIRWAPDDPVERFVFDALLLDARPSVFAAGADPGPLTAVVLDRDRLAADEPRLRAVFGLLVHAHYRTTPHDLELLLDAHGVRIHALMAGQRVAAVNLLVDEGRLTRALCAGLYRGAARVRGQVLPETLADCGRPDAGALSIVRSVRIATHPALRRRGLARRLTEAVHAAVRPDLFGTAFGATPALLSFRRSLGYRLVRLGISGGRRAGQPAAVMLRPVSAAARSLVHDLRRRLADGLPCQLALMATDQHLSPALIRSVTAGLPDATPTAAVTREAVAAYAFGPRAFESAAQATLRFVEAHRGALDALDPEARRLIERRVIDGQSWAALGEDFGGVRAAMRGLRRAMKALVRAVDPTLESSLGDEP